MSALTILRGASRHVPNEEYVEVFGALEDVAELIDAVKAAEAALRHAGSTLHADRLQAALAQVAA